MQSDMAAHLCSWLSTDNVLNMANKVVGENDKACSTSFPVVGLSTLVPGA